MAITRGIILTGIEIFSTKQLCGNCQKSGPKETFC